MTQLKKNLQNLKKFLLVKFNLLCFEKLLENMFSWIRPFLKVGIGPGQKVPDPWFQLGTRNWLALQNRKVKWFCAINQAGKPADWKPGRVQYQKINQL